MAKNRKDKNKPNTNAAVKEREPQTKTVEKKDSVEDIIRRKLLFAKEPVLILINPYNDYL